MAPELVAAGIDALHVSGGVIDPLTTQMVTGSRFGDAHNLAAAAAVKRVAGVPVMVVGRIHDAKLAEKILRDGGADLIVMGRPLLADPDLPAKAQAGRFAEIRRCISCQHCIDSMEKGRASCAVNPFAGREAELVPKPAAHAKQIVVVGAGPAGLETARLCARRGHRVTVYERQAHLGGALACAAAVHEENEPFLDFLRGEIGRLGIEVRLGQALDADAVAGLAPDAVVVATGGRLSAPKIPGDDQRHVVTGAWLRALFGGRLGRFVRPHRIRLASRLWMPLGRRVAIVGADLAAIELAEFLAERGRSVAVLETRDAIAPEVGPKRRAEQMERLDRCGVSVNTGVEIERISREGVVLRARGGPVLVAADSVILAGALEPDTSLYDSLRGRVSGAPRRGRLHRPRPDPQSHRRSRARRLCAIEESKETGWTRSIPRWSPPRARGATSRPRIKSAGSR